LSLLRVDERTGRLRQVEHVGFAFLPTPEEVAFSPDGRFLAASVTLPPLPDQSSVVFSGWLFIFAVNPHTGALRQVAARFVIRTYGAPQSIAFDPSGNFLAFTGLCSVRIFAFNRRSGALRKLPHSSYSTGDWRPSIVSVNPAGNLLAVTRGSGDSVWLYTMNQRTGQLTKTAEWSDGSGAFATNAIFSPDGRLLAVTSDGNCAVAVLSVEDVHKLVEVPGSPFLARACPRSVAFSPDGRMIATLSASGGDYDQRVTGLENKVAVVSLDEQTGAIQAPPGTPVGSAAGYASPLAFSPNGKLLVVGNGDEFASETVTVFFAPTACADPDDDNDCDP
jgi:6-phosphogluconolactonase (cycloisomerase 2 family)